ncbi:STAS domain-containing protein [Kitasatospora sp. NPDC085895]|uniref:STAS domain-containing protein n=1 Tax=Kitasatospora sp. NPDC085895 TaxID=3155057 RepID=UPI00344FFA61
MLASGDSSTPGPAELGERAIAEGALTLRLAAAGSATVLLMAGVLDARCAVELPEVLLSAARGCPGGLALDLRGVGECDEVGVAALGRACEHARRAGNPVGLAAATADLDRLMVLTDALHLVADHFDIGHDPQNPPG